MTFSDAPGNRFNSARVFGSIRLAGILFPGKHAGPPAVAAQLPGSSGIKVEGTGGSGLQYRSRTGLPWLANIPANVAAFNGPVNLNWMQTGPQADFWPSRVYTGQFYSENTPMRILAWRGQVVEGFGDTRKRLMGTIANREALGAIVKQNDWNQYT